MCQKLLLLLNLSVTTIAYEVRARSEFLHCTKGRTVSPGYCTSDKGILARCFQATSNANDANCAAACAKEKYCEYYSVGKGSYAGQCVLFGKDMQRNVNSKMANCYGGDTGTANSHGTYLSTWNSCIQMQCTNFYSKNMQVWVIGGLGRVVMF